MLVMFLWYQMPCSTDRSVVIMFFTAYLSAALTALISFNEPWPASPEA